MASKWKKRLKKVGKAAALAAAAYGATRLGRKRATDAPGNAAAAAKKLLTSDRAYTGKGYDDHIIRQPKLTSPVDEGIWGSPWGAKGGGIAKRGMGAAFKKGGHVKSMGIAKRGGGAAKR